jgi:hypothetical protein
MPRSSSRMAAMYVPTLCVLKICTHSLLLGIHYRFRITSRNPSSEARRPFPRMLKPETSTLLNDGDTVTFGKAVGKGDEWVKPVVAVVQLLYAATLSMPLPSLPRLRLRNPSPVLDDMAYMIPHLQKSYIQIRISRKSHPRSRHRLKHRLLDNRRHRAPRP